MTPSTLLEHLCLYVCVCLYVGVHDRLSSVKVVPAAHLEYHHFEGSSPAIGVYGTQNAPQAAWYIRTKDVRALLPRAVEGVESASGLTATCTDDQGKAVRL
jgi:hypothetical protein